MTAAPSSECVGAVAHSADAPRISDVLLCLSYAVITSFQCTAVGSYGELIVLGRPWSVISRYDSRVEYIA
ncbi:hypothetical protein EGR_11036 [Echinococcus granulosus]|uniref:Uncharacterized protein n=1 Tax=Echinococcus granulosus TaxID=6210 RepID=W6TZ84_ECHGR|nr:hypothetical protein EGR_11036 [Echinococcus granulosus]EUB54105.1 hypothetical protein EGR_11036 [Echinococcus granulosus]